MLHGFFNLSRLLAQRVCNLSHIVCYTGLAKGLVLFYNTDYIDYSPMSEHKCGPVILKQG